MTTRRDFLILGGGVAVAGLCVGNLVQGARQSSGKTLVMRDKAIPRSALPPIAGSAPELAFAGDYAGLVDIAERHFDDGGVRMVAAIDGAGALLLTYALRSRSHVRVTEMRLPNPIGNHLKLIIAETSRKA